MIISVDELRKYIETSESDPVLEAELQALELTIRKYTNNNFQQRNIRFKCPSVDGKLQMMTYLLSVGDTVQLSESMYCDGIYTITDIQSDSVTLDRKLFDETHILVTKVEYPDDVKMGAVKIMKWKLKNEAANDGDTSKKDIQSETISRHSVTYVQDASESDIDSEFGVPRKHIAFLKAYKKARF